MRNKNIYTKFIGKPVSVRHGQSPTKEYHGILVSVNAQNLVISLGSNLTDQILLNVRDSMLKYLEIDSVTFLNRRSNSVRHVEATIDDELDQRPRRKKRV